MAIGSLGDVVFVVSAEQVRTIKNFQRQGSARFAAHEVIGGKQQLEFTGADAESVTFKMTLCTTLGVIPVDEVKVLRDMRDTGKAVYLILDGEPQGKGLWVITDLQEEWDHIDAGGSPHLLEVSVSLKEYTEVS